MRCYYNFVRPHAALRFGREIRTPAMRAGLVTRRLTLREVFVRSRAAHTDLMDNCEQVFDEALFWRHFGQQGLRVTVHSDGNSLLDLPCS